MLFQDRADAGRRLAEALLPYQREDCLILGLPRGGVIVAYEVARSLQKPMDVLIVRKLGAPGYEELAIGAIAPNDVLVLNEDVIRQLDVDGHALNHQIEKKTLELKRRLQRFRGARPFPPLRDKTAIIVDDGLATGATARAAIQAVKAMRAFKIVLAVPVGAQSTVYQLRREVDELVCLETPMAFNAVGEWYRRFPQNSDEEVIALLNMSEAENAF